MTPEEISQAADLLAAARLSGNPVDLPAHLRPASLADAYLIQAGIARKLAWPVAGWKIGYTDPTKHALRGLTEPGYGRVFSSVLYRSPAALPTPQRQAIVEAEYAFRLRSDLPPRSAPYEIQDVTAAIDEMYLAIEVLASRHRNPQEMNAYAVIADNLHSGGLVCSASVPNWQDADLTTIPVAVYCDGKLVARGSGAEVMGHPLHALIWLANTLARTESWLTSGQVVTTGTCLGASSVTPHAHVEAGFGELGGVSLQYQST